MVSLHAERLCLRSQARSDAMSCMRVKTERCEINPDLKNAAAGGWTFADPSNALRRDDESPVGFQWGTRQTDGALCRSVSDAHE